MGLSARHRRTVEALGETLFPSLGPDDPSGGDILPEALDRFLADLSPEQARGLTTAIAIFDLGSLATRARRFHKLGDDARERYVRAWQTSRLPLRRIIYRALRNTFATIYYQDERTWQAIGYAGPLVKRPGGAS